MFLVTLTTVATAHAISYPTHYMPSEWMIRALATLGIAVTVTEESPA